MVTSLQLLLRPQCVVTRQSLLSCQDMSAAFNSCTGSKMMSEPLMRKKGVQACYAPSIVTHMAASAAPKQVEMMENISVGQRPVSPASVTDLTQLLEETTREDVLSDSVISESVQILRSNDYGGYTVPTRGLYPYQWNWDSALVAMGWAKVDEPRGWLEIETLMSSQWSDGMVPHIVFHQDSSTYFPGPEIWGTVEQPRGSTGITQPPVAAIAVRQLIEKSFDKEGSLIRAKKLFPSLLAYHQWFYSARDPLGMGLVATLHPWESGMDNSSAWDGPLSRVPVDDIPAYTRRDLGHVDAAMRPTKAEYDRYLTLLYRFRAQDYDPAELYFSSPFRVTDLCTNSVLHRANEDLLWLARVLGESDAVAEIKGWQEKSAKSFDKLWDADSKIFRSWDQLLDQPLPAATSAGFLPLFAHVATQEQAEALAVTLTRWLDAVEYGVPSLDPEDPKFEALRYWRGPVWLIVNYMISDGLRYYGLHDLADRIEENSRKLVNTHGLYEYYNPVTGSGAGGGYFSWTAAMCLAWLDNTN